MPCCAISSNAADTGASASSVAREAVITLEIGFDSGTCARVTRFSTSFRVRIPAGFASAEQIMTEPTRAASIAARACSSGVSGDTQTGARCSSVRRGREKRLSSSCARAYSDCTARCDCSSRLAMRRVQKSLKALLRPSNWRKSAAGKMKQKTSLAAR